MGKARLCGDHRSDRGKFCAGDLFWVLLRTGVAEGVLVYGMYRKTYDDTATDILFQIITLGTLTATTVINPSLHGPRWKTLRLSAFVATGFSAFAPIAHGALLFPYGQFDQQTGLRWYYLEGVLIMMGVWFYAVSYYVHRDIRLPGDSVR
jgi:predicted membrane channel-forming protein YqfA (hemolysin III family)